MMMLGHDLSGLESLPLKLLIVAIVATLTVIPAGEALDSLKNRDFMRRAEVQLEKIASSAEILSIGGPGNVRTFSLDFSHQGEIKFEKLVLGDSRDGANKSSIVLHFKSGAVLFRTASEPYAWITTEDGGGLEVFSPIFDLRMSCVLKNRTSCVIVEVA